MAKKKWTKQVDKRIEERGTAGSFRAWCKRQGYDSVTAECIQKGLNSDSEAIQRKARLAKAYARIRPARRKK